MAEAAPVESEAQEGAEQAASAEPETISVVDEPAPMEAAPQDVVAEAAPVESEAPVGAVEAAPAEAETISVVDESAPVEAAPSAEAEPVLAVNEVSESPDGGEEQPAVSPAPEG